jgi:16S rRNA (cytosine967-C5)-methyltransferase
LRSENEDIAQAFSQAHAGLFDSLSVADVLAGARVTAAQSLVSGPFLRTWPHLHGTDGFFAAVWQRR